MCFLQMGIAQTALDTPPPPSVERALLSTFSDPISFVCFLTQGTGATDGSKQELPVAGSRAYICCICLFAYRWYRANAGNNDQNWSPHILYQNAKCGMH